MRSGNRYPDGRWRGSLLDRRGEGTMTGYAVKLSLQIGRDDRDWVTWCPVIDVATQARTKGRALDGLREAVALWFESCIGRGVLDQALQQSGFRRVSGAAGAHDASESVTVQATQTPDRAVSVPDSVRSQISEERRDSCLEGFIPALLAEDDLGGCFHPTHGVEAPQRTVPGARA